MNNQKILIIDYKVGNNQSVMNALQLLGYDFLVSDKKEDIQSADALILPGVGAFEEAMENLKKLGILDVLRQQVIIFKKPILGICLGMQILAESGEENGIHEGLGWIPGEVKKIGGHAGVRVPHVGWNDVMIFKKEPLFSKIQDGAGFYFDHSYQFVCDGQYVAASCKYGNEVVVAVQKDNIFGVQFHPEKSQGNGLKLFRSFFDSLRITHA